MKRPKKIKLFGYVVRVVWDKSTHHSDPADSGKWYGDYNLLWVDKRKYNEGQRLMHELIHQIDGQLHIKLSEDDTDRLATALTEMIRVNSLDLIKFIKRSK